MKTKDSLLIFFRGQLLAWHRLENDRTHPWATSRDPYKIWLYEIILQQTRLAQGIPYYQRFITQYPTIRDLAAAPDDEVFKLWQGLGYYSRCRNLLWTARWIQNECGGIFPSTYEDILKLKGVGTYTAAAIASFAFDLPNAVLDGNVYRVLARFWGIETPIDTTEGRKEFSQLAQESLEKNQAAEYNQALMDLGATICTPQNPKCDICPLTSYCRARNQGLIELLPVKSKRLKIKERWFHYFVLSFEGKIYIQQRTEKDIWQQLYEYYLIEDKKPFKTDLYLENIAPFVLELKKDVFKNKQRLTHQLIHSYFHVVKLKLMPPKLTGGTWLSVEELRKLPFPKTVLDFDLGNLW